MPEGPSSLPLVRIELKEDQTLYSTKPITCPDDAVALLGDHIRKLNREMVWVICVDTKNRPIHASMIGMGSLSESMVPVAEALKIGLLSNARGLFLMHNHPSGDVTPSTNDIQITKRIEIACKYSDMFLIDHVIVGSETDTWYSFFAHDQIDLTKQLPLVGERETIRQQNDMEL